MWGSKQAILGANNNIKGTEQFRLVLVDVISSTFWPDGLKNDKAVKIGGHVLYFNIILLNIRMGALWKKWEKNVLLFLYWWGLWSVIVDSCTPRRCGRGLWNLLEQGNQCLLSWRCVSAIYTLIFKTTPQNLKDVTENELKMTKYR